MNTRSVRVAVAPLLRAWLTWRELIAVQGAGAHLRLLDRPATEGGVNGNGEQIEVNVCVGLAEARSIGAWISGTSCSGLPRGLRREPD